MSILFRRTIAESYRLSMNWTALKIRMLRLGLWFVLRTLSMTITARIYPRKSEKRRTCFAKKANTYLNRPSDTRKTRSDRYKLIIDEEAATVVRKIFNMYLEGMGTIRISQRLNELGIMTRGDYIKTGSIYREDNIVSSTKGWRPNGIRSMLSNKAYIGAVCQRRRTTRNYKDRKPIYLDEKDQIVVYDMHEPIVSKEQFDKVQEILKSRCTKTSQHSKELYLFSGMLRCAGCKSSMIRNPKFHKNKWYVYYKCRGYNQRGTKVCNHSHSIGEEKLVAAVRYALNIQIQTLVDMKRVIEAINKNKKQQRMSIDYDKLIEEKLVKKDKLKTMKLSSYMDWKSGTVSKDEYTFMRDKFDGMIEQLNNEMSALENEKTAEEDIRSNQYSWLDSMISNGYLSSLSREITTEFIDCIYVGKDKKIQIVFKHKNEFRRLTGYIENHVGSCYDEQGGVQYVSDGSAR